MRIEVEQAALSQVLQKVLNITEKKTSMPVLSNVMIKAADQASSQIDFSVTDLELSMWTQVTGTVISPGSTTVSARKLLEVVRELPQRTIVIEEQLNNRLLIEAGRARFELPTISSTDFPYLKFPVDIHLETCDGVKLRKCLEKTLYGIPMDEDPFSVSGLYLHAVGADELRFVASDGHRLVYYQVEKSAFSGLQSEIGNGIIIPRKGVAEIIRIVEKETDILAGIQENCLMVKSPLTTLSIQLLEGEFPEYELIIPSERPFHIELDRESLYHALKRVAVLTDQKWRHVRLTFSNGSLELDGGNPDLGNANEALDVDYEGEVFSVAFNIRYILDAVQVIESSHIRFEWVDEFHGGVFLGLDEPDYFSLIMPMVV